MSKVKLISGWSNAGGSTIHHINLTNLLNENGLDCTYYGPHSWHLGQCNAVQVDGGTLGDLLLAAEPDDIIIHHFLKPGLEVGNAKKVILSCHETDMYMLKEMEASGYLSKWDAIQYVSEFQKNWHSVDHTNLSSVVIPPITSKVKWSNPNNKTVGVIGSIDTHKQTHLSIRRALEDGFEKVMLFGYITDQGYFNNYILPWIQVDNVVHVGHEDNREAMYEQISAVYHSSKRETYGLVEAECKLSGIPFDGPKNNQVILDKQEIFEKWKELLEL